MELLFISGLMVRGSACVCTVRFVAKHVMSVKFAYSFGLLWERLPLLPMR